MIFVLDDVMHVVIELTIKNTILFEVVNHSQLMMLDEVIKQKLVASKLFDYVDDIDFLV